MPTVLRLQRNYGGRVPARRGEVVVVVAVVAKTKKRSGDVPSARRGGLSYVVMS